MVKSLKEAIVVIWKHVNSNNDIKIQFSLTGIFSFAFYSFFFFSFIEV